MKCSTCAIICICHIVKIHEIINKYWIFTDGGGAGERIKLSVNYDERFGVTTTEKEGETENLDML